MEKLKKEKEELDRRIAEELWKQEQREEEERIRKEEARKKNEEWDKALEAARREARAEADAQLGKKKNPHIF